MDQPEKKLCRINFWYFALTDIYLYLAALIVFCTPCAQQFQHGRQIEMILNFQGLFLWGKLFMNLAANLTKIFSDLPMKILRPNFLTFPENFLTFRNFLVGKFFLKNKFSGMKTDFFWILTLEGLSPDEFSGINWGPRAMVGNHCEKDMQIILGIKFQPKITFPLICQSVERRNYNKILG